MCTNPQYAAGDFDVTRLQGNWFQVMTNAMGDSIGCLQYQFALDPAENDDTLPAVNLHASWTAFNTWWNPIEKGDYAATYELYGDTDGRLFEREWLSNKTTYSYIVATDYSTYFVEYGCK